MSHNQTVKAAKRKPVVLMTMGAQERKGHPYQVMTHKYILPLTEISGCVPLLVPTCCGTADLEQYLAMADGIYLTGAGSNIDPALYGQENLTPDKAQDQERDLFDLPLIRAALERGLPFLGVCRGMQELNVALGGDIYQQAYAEPGFDDHREDFTAEVAVQYGASHAVRPVAGSWFAELMRDESFVVNSLHGQALNRLGKGLEPLAHADDGMVEAVHLPTLPQFTLGVQWHPEWQAQDNPQSVLIYRAFGDAFRARAAQQAG